MAIYLMEIGPTIRQMALEFTIIRMVLSILANGKTIYSTERDKKFGLMVVNTKGVTGLARNTATANISGLMAQTTTEIGSITKFRERVLITGWMDVATLAIGRTIICMDRAFTVGKMEGDTKEAMLRIKSMVLGYITGMMAEDMKVIGLTGDNTGKGSI